MVRQNDAIVPYGQGGQVTIDVNGDGFADNQPYGRPAIATIDTSQSKAVWTWLKVFPSLVKHQWITLIIATTILSVLVPTGLHMIAALLRPDARYLEAKDGGAAGNLAPWVWATNLVTAVKQPVANTAATLQDAAIDNSGDVKAANLQTRKRSNVQ